MAFPRLFCSKDAIVEFSEKVEAEAILGVKPRVRPKDLRFIANMPRPESRLKIEYQVGGWRDLPQAWRDELQRYGNYPNPEPGGCFFRLANSGSVDVRVRDVYVADGGERIVTAESASSPTYRLRPGESAVFLVSGQKLTRKMLERGHGDSGWATVVVTESGLKRHTKSFEVTHLEQRAAS